MLLLKLVIDKINYLTRNNTSITTVNTRISVNRLNKHQNRPKKHLLVRISGINVLDLQLVFF